MAAVLELMPHECLRCGHRWENGIEFPGTCPRCKASNWDVPRGTMLHRDALGKFPKLPER